MIGKAEHLAKGANPRFIVTSLKRKAIDAQTLYEQVYCAAARWRTGSRNASSICWPTAPRQRRWPPTSCGCGSRRSPTCCSRALRRIGLPHTELAQATCGSIRPKLLKLGARVTVSVRRIEIAIASPARTRPSSPRRMPGCAHRPAEPEARTPSSE